MLLGAHCRYRAETDPWRLTDAEPSPPRQYLWRFYNTTARYLAHQVRWPIYRRMLQAAHMYGTCSVEDAPRSQQLRGMCRIAR